jgi:hypothetical protein
VRFQEKGVRSSYPTEPRIQISFSSQRMKQDPTGARMAIELLPVNVGNGTEIFDLSQETSLHASSAVR